MHRLLLIAALLSPSLALAQQQQDAADRTVQALGAQVGSLVLQINRQQDQLTALQADLIKAQAEVQRLKDEKKN